MKVIGIETSCDETAVAVLEIKDDSVTVLSNTISSQVKLHAKYGGVVPNLAAREHVKNIEHVFKLSLHPVRSSLAKVQRTRAFGTSKTSYGIKEAMQEIDLIAVTRGPGLGPALLVGITFARTLAWKYNKPLVGANHMEGHLYSNWLKPVGVKSKFSRFVKTNRGSSIAKQSRQFPILNLIVSGGHTELVLMENYGKYKIIGETLDDAVGEAFDKVARLLGLGYPGGPMISKIAEKGNPDRYPLPSPMINSKDYNFSYSGLKTAVLYLLRDMKFPIRNSKFVIRNSQIKADIAASFQKAATEVVIKKTIKAAKEYKVKSVFLSGGVSANRYLRSELGKQVADMGLAYSQPELEYTGDNAAMIALAGYFSSRNKKSQDLTWDSAEMDANLSF